MRKLLPLAESRPRGNPRPVRVEGAWLPEMSRTSKWKFESSGHGDPLGLREWASLSSLGNGLIAGSTVTPFKTNECRSGIGMLASRATPRMRDPSIETSGYPHRVCRNTTTPTKWGVLIPTETGSTRSSRHWTGAAVAVAGRRRRRTAGVMRRAMRGDFPRRQGDFGPERAPAISRALCPRRPFRVS